MTAAQLNTFISSLPHVGYVYGFRLMNGKDINISAKSFPIDPANTTGIEDNDLPIPFTIDTTTNSVVFNQKIQTFQGPQLMVQHHVDIDKIVDVLTFIVTP